MTMSQKNLSMPLCKNIKMKSLIHASYSTQGIEPRLGLQIDSYKRTKQNDSDTTHAMTQDATNNDICMIQHNSIYDKV